ncbi:MAG: hypothetical protein HS116_25115 [Planctomycetes bacterium]|nr:hypothetical protein [Planctomycetota bacterium]
MFLNTADIRDRIRVELPATIASYDHMHPILNAAGWTLNANGVAVTTSTSSMMALMVGGFVNQKITASIKYTSPTNQGSEDIGLLARLYTNQTGYATYYYCRQTGGNFRIGKNVDGTFTTLANQNYALAQNTYALMILRVIGSSLYAMIDDGVQEPLELNATDSAIPGPGAMGFRSGPTNSSTVAVRSLIAEEAA